MKKILIVEDEIAIRVFLKNSFQTHYQVFQTWNGEEAIKIIDSHHPHLVITGLGLPDMDGEKLIRFIRKAHTDIKIIVLTCRSSREPEARAAGCDAFFLKPYAFSALAEKVKRLLGE